MSNLSVNLQYCFGIHTLEHNFDFTHNRTALIYAPNGLMKSSFAKTFDCIAKNKEPKDIVYQERNTSYEIKLDGEDISPESILVVNTDEDINANDKITTLLASKEIKKEYDSIYQTLEEEKHNFLKLLKDKSSSSDCESEIIETFKTNERDDLFTCLSNMRDKINEYHPLYEFKYNDVFDKKGNVEKFLNQHQELLEQYFNNYRILLNQSHLFKSNQSGVSFGTYQANQILNSVSDEAFFKADHQIMLSDGTRITSTMELKNLIQREINNIFEDDSLKKSFEKIDKAIGNNSELRLFKSVLEKNKSLVIELHDYKSVKKKVWLGYLHLLQNYVMMLIHSYDDKKTKLTEILKKAKEENSKWSDIISIYNNRFFVPFKIEIQNREDVVLKEETAKLIFSYKDSMGEFKKQEKDTLLTVLSKGEKRAFSILQFLFEIEARKTAGQQTLLILDDIADSFDYKNKYAIIEYIKDISDNDLFIQIILTHNFDFYRTLSSRLELRNSVFMALKNDNGAIVLKPGGYRKDFFGGVVTKNITNPKDFIAMIPFTRNIIEYTKGQDCDEYKKLTSCLHSKEESKNLSKNDIFKIFTDCFDVCKGVQIDEPDENIIDFIKNVATNILEENDLNDILLENKLVLSIATRLVAEEFIIEKLPEIDINQITTNQTRVLINKYKENFPIDDSNIKLLEEVNLMTSENIHLNSFMYEPLIDMSINHLTRLYKKILDLSNQ